MSERQWLSLVVLPLMTYQLGLNAYSTVSSMVQQSTVGPPQRVLF